MALKPGPMQVVHNFFSTKAEVLDDIKALLLLDSADSPMMTSRRQK